MPVRSSVCTYSPSTVSNSKYSLATPSALSVGHYKPLSTSPNLSSHQTSLSPRSYTSSGISSSSGFGSSSLSSQSPSSRYSLSSSTSSYSPSSYNSSYSSLGSTSSSSSSYTPSSSSLGQYRPLKSAQSSFKSSPGSRFESKSLSSTSPSSYTRYSPGSSTASTTSSSSLSSAGSSLLDRSDTLTRTGYSASIGSSNYNYRRPSSSASLSSSRRLSHTSLASSTNNNEPLPSGVPRGLVNLGNTCYMNAVIQSLYSIDSFRNLILRASHDKILTSELSDLFKSMKNSSSSISPANFKYAFSRHQAKFSGLNQQDAQEFLRYLINGVHEEHNQASRRPRRSGPPRAPKTADEAWSQYKDIVDDSPFVDIVVGQMCSTIVCTVCQNKSLCWDPFWDLSLPLNRDRHSCKLSDVVQNFIAKETLDSDERPICSTCKQATRSTKQIKVCRLPKLMILHLKKFTNDGYKLSSPEIRIDNVLIFNDNATYTLAACISHHGHSSSSGHYTSHCKYSSRWFHFNDDRVRDVTSSFDGAKLNDAYVLFYTQSSSSSASSPMSTTNQSKL